MPETAYLQLGAGLLAALPIAVIAVTGIVTALRRRASLGTAALLTILGLGALVTGAVGRAGLEAYQANQIVPAGGLADFARHIALVYACLAALNIGGLALLTAAVFFGRGPAARAA